MAVSLKLNNMIIVGWSLVFIGLFVVFSGIIGLIRFPDFYTKIHAAGVIDACGIPVCLVGLALMQVGSVNSFKLVFGSILVLLLSPTATQALAKASLLKHKKYDIDQININVSNENDGV